MTEEEAPLPMAVVLAASDAGTTTMSECKRPKVKRASSQVVVSQATGGGASKDGVQASTVVVVARAPTTSKVPPTTSRLKLGTYGAGAHKNECWSLQAYQKRVYAIRESHKVFLKGTVIENPGFDDRVGNKLSSIARLVGKQSVHVPDALVPKQVAALVHAADPKNRKLVLSAALIAKGVVDTNRSKQEGLLDHKEIAIDIDDQGVMRGVATKVALTKTDRLQLGDTQRLRCPDDCDGTGVKFDAEGRFDASLLCPACLLLYAQELTAEELGVTVEMLGECPFWADYAWYETLPKGRHTLVAGSDESNLYTAKLRKGVEVISNEEETRRGRSTYVALPSFDGEERGYKAGASVWFEHVVHGFLVHAWPNSAAFTMRMRVLAVCAQRQAHAAEVDAPFGDAWKVEDFKGILSTRVLRRSGATAIAQSGRPDALQLGMKTTGHSTPAMFEKYVQKVNAHSPEAPNVSSIVLRQPMAVMEASASTISALEAATAAKATAATATVATEFLGCGVARSGYVYYDRILRYAPPGHSPFRAAFRAAPSSIVLRRHAHTYVHPRRGKICLSRS